MKTWTHLFDQLATAEHLDRSLRLAARGKRRRADVAWVLFRWEAVRAQLLSELHAGAWRPRGFDLVRIRDPKRRIISRAPFEDRVVHTALVDLLEPVFGPSMDPGDLACRVGGGTHRALLRLQRHQRRHRFCAHLDIKSCFYSVDVEVLRALVARKVRDRRFMAVLDAVLASGRGLLDHPGIRGWLGLDAEWPAPGRGLPLGAQTSQFLLTHVYLQGLDHFIKRQLKVPGYVRYVDDLFLFGRGRAEVRRWQAHVGAWLQQHRHQRLKHPHARILSCGGSLHALGHVVRRDEVLPGPTMRRRFRQRVRDQVEEREQRGRQERLQRSTASSVGLLLGP